MNFFDFSFYVCVFQNEIISLVSRAWSWHLKQKLSLLFSRTDLRTLSTWLLYRNCSPSWKLTLLNCLLPTTQKKILYLSAKPSWCAGPDAHSWQERRKVATQNRERGQHEKQDTTRSRARFWRRSTQSDHPKIKASKTLRHKLPLHSHCQCHCIVHRITWDSKDQEGCPAHEAFYTAGFFHYCLIKLRKIWKILESSQEDRNHHEYYPCNPGLLMSMEQYFPRKEFQTVSHWW